MASTDREHVELTALANEMADRIVQSHDWQVLKKQATITGDGTTESHSLPSDYDRMLTKAQVWSSSLETPLSPVTDTDEWLGLDVQSFDFVVNAWTVHGGQIHIKPALATGVTASIFLRFRSNRCSRQRHEQKHLHGRYRHIPAFRAAVEPRDDLAMGGPIKGFLIRKTWRPFEAQKETLISRDKGSRMMRLGTVRLPGELKHAYPQSVTP